MAAGLNNTGPKSLMGLVMALVVLLYTAGLARAAEPLKYVSVPHKSEVEVCGTSTLHDWTARSNTIKGALVFWEYHRTAVMAADHAFPLEGGQPIALDFWIPVNSLLSDSDGLNEQIWNNLDMRDHPVIKFSYTSAKFVSRESAVEVLFEVHGALTINGVRKPQKLRVSVKDPLKSELTITTETKLKMSDFKITPPTFMGGLLKSDDQVRVKVKWVVGLYKTPQPSPSD